MEAHLIYKCRNCEVRFTVLETLDKGGTDGKHGEILSKAISSGRLIAVHDCKSKMKTTFGVADLIGIVRG